MRALRSFGLISLFCFCFFGDDRYNPKKLTYEERKASLIERVKALNSAGGAADDDDDEDDQQ